MLDLLTTHSLSDFWFELEWDFGWCSLYGLVHRLFIEKREEQQCWTLRQRERDINKYWGLPCCWGHFLWEESEFHRKSYFENVFDFYMRIRFPQINLVWKNISLTFNESFFYLRIILEGYSLNNKIRFRSEPPLPGEIPTIHWPLPHYQIWIPNISIFIIQVWFPVTCVMFYPKDDHKSRPTLCVLLENKQFLSTNRDTTYGATPLSLCCSQSGWEVPCRLVGASRCLSLSVCAQHWHENEVNLVNVLPRQHISQGVGRGVMSIYFHKT